MPEQHDHGGALGERRQCQYEGFGFVITNSRKHFIRPPCRDHVSAYCAGWSGDVVAATSFTAAALIGAAPALESQAIASPAARPPGDDRPNIDALKARIEHLQAELARLEMEKSCIEATASRHREDFERERCDTIVDETLKMTKAAMSARETVARLEGELAARQSRPWWRRGIKLFGIAKAKAVLTA